MIFPSPSPPIRDPVPAGASLTYSLALLKFTGPADATEVMVTNILPANVALLLGRALRRGNGKKPTE